MSAMASLRPQRSAPAWDRATPTGGGTAPAGTSLCFWRRPKQLRTRLGAARDSHRAWCRSSVSRRFGLLPGQMPAQLTMSAAEGKASTVGPTSATRVQAKRCLMPGRGHPKTWLVRVVTSAAFRFRTGSKRPSTNGQWQLESGRAEFSELSHGWERCGATASRRMSCGMWSRATDGPVTIFSDGVNVFELRWFSADDQALNYP
jgi:hypothetical protein